MRDIGNDCDRELPLFDMISFDYISAKTTDGHRYFLTVSLLDSFVKIKSIPVSEPKEKKTLRFNPIVGTRMIDNIEGTKSSANYILIAVFDKPVADTSGNDRSIIASNEVNSKGQINGNGRYEAFENSYRNTIAKLLKTDDASKMVYTEIKGLSNEEEGPVVGEPVIEKTYEEQFDEAFPLKEKYYWYNVNEFYDLLDAVKAIDNKYVLYKWFPHTKSVYRVEGDY